LLSSPKRVSLWGGPIATHGFVRKRKGKGTEKKKKRKGKEEERKRNGRGKEEERKREEKGKEKEGKSKEEEAPSLIPEEEGGGQGLWSVVWGYFEQTGIVWHP